jgi:hypothetical protein
VSDAGITGRIPSLHVPVREPERSSSPITDVRVKAGMPLQIVRQQHVVRGQNQGSPVNGLNPMTPQEHAMRMVLLTTIASLTFGFAGMSSASAVPLGTISISELAAANSLISRAYTYYHHHAHHHGRSSGNSAYYRSYHPAGDTCSSTNRACR